MRYRTPFGAVKAGEAVHILADKQGEGKLYLRLWVNGGERLLEGEDAGGSIAFQFVAEDTGLIWYYFILEQDGRRRYYGVEQGNGGAGRFYDSPPGSWQITVYDPAYTTPAWFREGIAYQIFPDRFYRSGQVQGVEAHEQLGHRVILHDSWEEQPMYRPPEGMAHYDPCDFFGGNLNGIREKLPYLASLGVSCIYLNPVFLSPSNHRYNTADYQRVDPMLGTEADLAELARAAKTYGIRLMLDGVFSHTGDDSVYFDAKGTFGGGACSDPNSPYRAWYTFTHYPDAYHCWWGFRSLPEVQEMEPSYMAFVGKVLAQYAQLGITSWRLDVADELPDPFIAFLRRQLKTLDPQGVLLGEVWDDASNKEGFGQRRQYVDGKELDSAMGYPFKNAVLDFLLGRITADALQQLLLGLMENYPRPFLEAQLNILGSHDTIRALTVLSGAPGRDDLSREEQAVWAPEPKALALGKAKLRLAVLLQFGMPGVPCIYYGDEAGMTGMADPFSRGAYPWGHVDEEQLAFYRDVAAARKGSAALFRGGCGMAALSPDVFALLRCEGQSGALVLVNRAGQAYYAVLGMDRFQEGPDCHRLWIQGRYRDAVTGQEFVAENGGLCVQLEPYQGMMLIRVD